MFCFLCLSLHGLLFAVAFSRCIFCFCLLKFGDFVFSFIYALIALSFLSSFWRMAALESKQVLSETLFLDALFQRK